MHLSIFLEKKCNFMHFERLFTFQMHKIIFFLENLKKIIATKFKLGRVGLP